MMDKLLDQKVKPIRLWRSLEIPSSPKAPVSICVVNHLLTGRIVHYSRR